VLQTIERSLEEAVLQTAGREEVLSDMMPSALSGAAPPVADAHSRLEESLRALARCEEQAQYVAGETDTALTAALEGLNRWLAGVGSGSLSARDS
jgi:hypothetical protein